MRTVTTRQAPGEWRGQHVPRRRRQRVGAAPAERAPSLDFLSSDIYFDDFVNWSSSYLGADNPLFVPEAAGGATGSANALYAYGHLRAIGFCAFGMDGGDTTLGDTYAELSDLSPMILQQQAAGGIDTLIMEGSAQREGRLRIVEYLANMSRLQGEDPNSRMSAMFLHTGSNGWLVVGSGDSQITFTTDTPGPGTVGIASTDEGTIKNGRFVPGRRLNGDEDGQGQTLSLPRGCGYRKLAGSVAIFPTACPESHSGANVQAGGLRSNLSHRLPPTINSDAVRCLEYEQVVCSPDAAAPNLDLLFRCGTCQACKHDLGETGRCCGGSVAAVSHDAGVGHEDDSDVTGFRVLSYGAGALSSPHHPKRRSPRGSAKLGDLRTRSCVADDEVGQSPIAGLHSADGEHIFPQAGPGVRIPCRGCGCFRPFS